MSVCTAPVHARGAPTSLTPVRSRVLQRKCACGSHTTKEGECDECRKARSTLRRTSSSEAEPVPPIVHGVPAIVHDVLRSPGHPLDRSTRAFMEPRIGQDLSGVRIHADGKAGDSARAVAALAYTVGQDVVFGSGQYAPHSGMGRRLLAHELAHTVQQGAAPSRGPLAIAENGGAAEREADQAADGLARGERVDVGSAPGALLQRQSLSDTSRDTAGDGLIEDASPFLAAAVGSATLDQFDTGKADLKPAHKSQLASVAHSIVVLLRKYSLSTVSVVGHADTLATQARNLRLGQDRADVVKQALSDLGLPEAIISADTRGEGAPQAVPTRDATPSGLNRRVEIRFHPRATHLKLMAGGLTPPIGGKPWEEFDPLKKPRPDLTYCPGIEPPDPTKVSPDVWKPIPPAPKGSGPRSALDVIAEKVVDPVIDAVAGRLSKNLRDKIKAGARDAVKSGVAKGARAAAEAAGLKDPAGLDAIEKATEAAIQEEGAKQP